MNLDKANMLLTDFVKWIDEHPETKNYVEQFDVHIAVEILRNSSLAMTGQFDLRHFVLFGIFLTNSFDFINSDISKKKENIIDIPEVFRNFIDSLVEKNENENNTG